MNALIKYTIIYINKFIIICKKGEWKVQISMQIRFITINDELRTDIMHLKSDNVEIMRGIEVDAIINTLINTFKNRYQALENKMRGSSFDFDSIHLLEYHFNKITISRGSSYISTPARIANKNCTINPHNTKDNMCLMYAIVLTLNKIDNNPQRISKITPCLKYYDWSEINFPAGPKEYSALEKYNENTALNIFYAMDDEKDIRPCYISKHNQILKYHANLLMITNGKGMWHYIAIKSIPALLRGISSKHNGDYYCLNCFHSYRTKNTLEKHESLCNNNAFGPIKMPEEKNKFISSTPGKNTLKNPFIIYANFECLLHPMSTCDNTPDNSYTTKKVIHIPTGFSMLTSYAYDKKLNYHTCYRGKNRLQTFSTALKKKIEKIVSIKRNPMDPLTEQEIIAHNNAKTCFI